MHNTFRKLIPNKIVNLLKHFPLAVLANLIYGFPSKNMKFIGVTGTDGKTTTTNMIYQILKSAGIKASMVSTINAEINGEKIDTGFHVTNPDPFLLQKLISRAKKAGTQIFVLEVTSHGLDQFRTWGINFDIGVITNITHEHLDYHKHWENYFKSKAKLIKNAGIGVINRSESHFERLKKFSSGRIVSFGLTKTADFNHKKFPIKLSVEGEFNMLNALAASAVCVNLGINTKIIRNALETFEALEGRMEEVPNSLGIKIFIDFAHTPFALEQALKALREKTDKRLIAVFGSAGQRDIEKRSMMGEISARVADVTVITAEDPRGEIDKINQEILSGAKKSGGILGENVFIEGDRQKAIEFAIKKLADKGDLVGIFGKGHEKSMNIDGRVELPWSDLEAVKKVLHEAKN